jgi:hypothetical protein
MRGNAESRRRVHDAIVVAAFVAGIWSAVAAGERGAAGMAKLDDPNALRGQIIVDPAHPAWLKRNGGGPVYLCGPGDPEDFLYRGKRRPDGTRDGDQEKLIRKLIAHGGNCIYMQAIRSHGGDGQRDHNPFVDSDPAKGLSKPILDQWAGWFERMDKSDICIYLFVYDDSARIWKTGDKVDAAEKAFLGGLARRFGTLRNLIWVVAEEYAERLSARRVKSIAAALRAADPHNHVIAVHKNNGLSFREFAGDANIKQFAVQWNVPTAKALHDGMLKAWSEAAGRYGLNMSEAKGHPTDMRRKNWACATAGAHAMVLGMDIATTAPKDLAACRIQQRFLESTDLNTMAPHDELAAGTARYVLADPPRSYIVYADEASGAVGIRKMAAGAYDLTWLDCVSGRRVEQAGVKVAGGEASWRAPAGIGGELAVWVRKAPGRP